MKTIRRISLLLAVGLFTLALNTDTYAGKISISMAKRIASQTVEANFPPEFLHLKDQISLQNLKAELPFYLCQTGNQGYVLVAKDDLCPEVLGFSYEGPDFNFSSLEDNANPILDILIAQCQLYMSGAAIKPEKSLNPGNPVLFIPPIINLNWKEDSSFCKRLPSGWAGQASQVIAMGQLFAHFTKDPQGTGQHCYVHANDGNLCADYRTKIVDVAEWSIDTADFNARELLYWMSVACELQPNGTSFENFIETLPTLLGYSTKMRRSEFWEQDFEALILTQLEFNRPIPVEWAEHAFLIDGIIPGNQYHCNLGIANVDNGFFLLDLPLLQSTPMQALMSIYTDFHPSSTLPVPIVQNLSQLGDNTLLSWSINLPDSLLAFPVNFIILKDGLYKVGETLEHQIILTPDQLSESSYISMVADYDAFGYSELSTPALNINDFSIADIPSIPLRQTLNLKLGYTSNIQRQPFVGELDLIKSLEVSFADQRGLDQLPNLRSMTILGNTFEELTVGPYLQQLKRLRFYECNYFKFSNLAYTNSLIQAQGYDYLPYDLYDLRHNANIFSVQMGARDNYSTNLMDLYGVDKYFPNLIDFQVYHVVNFVVLDNSWVSYESWNDFIPAISSNAFVIENTNPSPYVPCYPSPARHSNNKDVSKLSWQSNANNTPDVYYNIYIGNSRDNMQLASAYQTVNEFSTTFEVNKHYYWRVEAFHLDTVYYSGYFHFTTYDGVQFPYHEDFDNFYQNCPIGDETPFWNYAETDNFSPAKVTQDVPRSGWYSLKLNPMEEIQLTVPYTYAEDYGLEFYIWNKDGKFTAELWQYVDKEGTKAVNSSLEFTGSSFGKLLSNASEQQFLFLADEWNRVNININHASGMASLKVNGNQVAEWPWPYQMDGTPNIRDFAGIQFRNASDANGSVYIDEFQVHRELISGTIPQSMPDIDIFYSEMSHELLIDHFESISNSASTSLSLIDIKGSTLMQIDHLKANRVALNQDLHNGIYLVRITNQDGKILSKKLSIQR